MKEYTVTTKHGWHTVNGHPVRMSQAEATGMVRLMLRDWPKCQAAVYRLSDSELVTVAHEWPTLTTSARKVLCGIVA